MVQEGVLAEISQRLVASLDPERIILFGSQAKGNADPESDIDLFVIVSDSYLSPARRSAEARRYLRGLSVAIDIIVRTRAEFERYRDARTSLEWDVVHHGIALHG